MTRHSMLYMYSFVRSCTLFYLLDKSAQFYMTKDNNYCGLTHPKVNLVSVRLGW